MAAQIAPTEAPIVAERTSCRILDIGCWVSQILQALGIVNLLFWIFSPIVSLFSSNDDDDDEGGKGKNKRLIPLNLGNGTNPVPSF